MSWLNRHRIDMWLASSFGAVPAVNYFLLLADNSSKLLLADNSSKLILAGP